MYTKGVEVRQFLDTNLQDLDILKLILNHFKRFSGALFAEHRPIISIQKEEIC